MSEVFLLAMFLGLGAIAVWLHVRYPRRRPGSLLRAAAHVVLSCIGFGLVPGALSLLLTHVAPSPLRLVLGLAVVMPAVTYWLLSWVWLLARIVSMLGGTPRGGLPASNES